MSDGVVAAGAVEERRIAMMFCDVVDSTGLSQQLEPEPYWQLMSGYRRRCSDVIERGFDGHVVRVIGDGLFSIFGFPTAHENDTERAVRAGLALLQAVAELPPAEGTARRLAVRIGIHAGSVLLERDDPDVYGWAANIAARFAEVAEPGTVVVSDDVRRRVEEHFAFSAMEPRSAKGVDEPLRPFRVLGERRTPARRWSTPLIERDGELARIREAWAHVAAGAGSAGLLVHGDAGLGKSRLACAFAEEAREAGAHVVELHGSDIHAGAGLQPLRTLVEQRCDIAAEDTGSQRLARLEAELSAVGLDPAASLPFLAPVLGISPSAGYVEAPLAGALLEEQVGTAVTDYLVACLGDRPAVVVAENLHWFDAASLALVRRLARLRTAAALVVATSRSATPGPWDMIELRPLTAGGRLALIDALAARLPVRERHAVSERSGGVPLYIEELVHALPAAEVAPVGPVPGSVPDTLYEPLVARLYATPAAVDVASAAAVAGPQVDRSLLAATAGKPAAELDAALRALVDAQVLEPVGETTARFRFRHELLRDVAYGLPLASVRRGLHGRMSDVLAAEPPDDWHLLAYHGERGERFGVAANAYRHISELARRRGALDEAAGHLSRALELLAREPPDAARDHGEVGLLLRRAFLVMSKDGAAAEGVAEDYERCRRLAAADPRGDDMLSTLIAVWAYDLSRAELDEARRLSETIRDSLGDARGYFRPENRAGFGMLDWFGGRFDSARATLSAAVEELAECGGPEEVAAVWFVPNDPFVAMHAHLALAHCMAGDLAAAADSLARARTIAATLDFPQGPWSAAYVLWLGSWIWIEAGSLDTAAGLVEELLAICERHGFLAWGLIGGTHAAALQAARMLRDGAAGADALEEQATTLASLAELWLENRVRVFLPFYLSVIGALLHAAGNTGGAQSRLEQSLTLSAETGMTFYDAETHRLLAGLAPDGAAREVALRRALELARRQGARPFTARIERDLADLVGTDTRPERAAR